MNQKQYVKMEGYIEFTDKSFSREMLKAFLNVSAVLDKQVFRELEWQQFHGTVKKLKALKSDILDTETAVKGKHIRNVKFTTGAHHSVFIKGTVTQFQKLKTGDSYDRGRF